MDQAFTRTRRNMIGVSVVLALVYAFDWGFPSELRIFGNVIPANPRAVQIIVWIALAYFVWEYLVHLAAKMSGLRGEWRNRFVAAHEARLNRKMAKKYDAKPIQRVIDMQKKKGYDSILGFQKVQLANGNHYFFRQEIAVTSYVRMEQRGSQADFPFEEKEPYKAYYLYSPMQLLRAWFRCLFTSSAYFEFVLPILFPLAAIIALIAGPFPWLIDGSSTPSTSDFVPWTTL